MRLIATIAAGLFTLAGALYGLLWWMARTVPRLPRQGALEQHG